MLFRKPESLGILKRGSPSLRLDMVDILPDYLPSRHFTSGRPIAEPPVFDYEQFIAEDVPSDIRMKLLFPDDIAQRTKYRDTKTERMLLKMYCGSIAGLFEGPVIFNRSRGLEVVNVVSAVGANAKLGRFYRASLEELEIDEADVGREFNEVNAAKTKDRLAVWEYEYLDQDGGTRHLEQFLQAGLDVEWDTVPGAIEKYAHLAPHGYNERITKGRLDVWEKDFLDDDGGITKIQMLIAKGKCDQIFDPDGYPEGGEARAKYGYLIEEHNASAMAATKAIIESVRELFPETPHSTPEQEEPKHESTIREPLSPTVPVNRGSKHSDITPTTYLALLPLLALELYLVYHAYIEWTSRYT